MIGICFENLVHSALPLLIGWLCGLVARCSFSSDTLIVAPHVSCGALSSLCLGFMQAVNGKTAAP